MDINTIYNAAVELQAHSAERSLEDCAGIVLTGLPLASIFRQALPMLRETGSTHEDFAHMLVLKRKDQLQSGQTIPESHVSALKSFPATLEKIQEVLSSKQKM